MKFKDVTAENWSDPDGPASVWAKLNKLDGTVSAVTGADWVSSVREIRLADHVNEQVVEFFELAKRALGYGHFYYPIFTLVTHQVTRVADIAVDVLFDELGVGKKPNSLDRKIVILREHWIIDDDMFYRLDVMRARRNLVTHGTFLEIMLPTHALREIKWAAELISDMPWPSKSST